MQIVGESQRRFEDGCEGFFTRFSAHVTAEVKRSERRCESVFGHASRRREPRVAGARVTLGGVHMDVSITVLDLTVDEVLTRECIVLLERFACPKAVRIDARRFLLAVGLQESNP